MKYLLALYLVWIPQMYWWDKPVRGAQEILFQLLGMIIMMALLFLEKHPIRLTKVSLCLGIFGVWTVCLYALGKCTIGFNYLLNVFLFIGVYFATLACYKKDDFNLLRKSILWVFFLTTIYIISQRLGFDIVGFVDRAPSGGVPKDTGLLGLPAHYGIYTSIAIAMMATRSPRTSILLFGFLALSKSSGAIVAGVVVYLFILWFRRHEVKFTVPYLILKKQKWFIGLRKLFIPYFFLAAILVTSVAGWYVIKVDQPMGMFTSRPPAWKLMINDAFKRPLWGSGLGAIRQGDLLYAKYSKSDATVRAVRTKDNVFRLVEKEAKKHNIPHNAKMDLWDNTHNEYINLLYHFSIVGVILIGFLFYFMFLRLRTVVITKELASIVGVILVLLLSSVTQFPFSVARLACIAPVMLGMFMIHSET